MKPLLLIFPLALTFAACGSTNNSGTGGTTTGGNTVGTCTASTTVSYATDVAPVLSNLCVQCHSATPTNTTEPDSSWPLDSYTNAQSTLTPAHLSFLSSMPPAGYGTLSADQNCVLINWVNQNYPQ